MSESYLWDRTGEADPELASWERDLSAFRAAPRQRTAPLGRRPVWLTAIAAGAFVLVIAAGYREYAARTCQVEGFRGEPRLNGAPVRGAVSLPAGAVFETGANESATLGVGIAGSVRLGERTRIRLVEMGRNRQRIQLERGRLDASIREAPYGFSVLTAASLIDDLGCVYCVETDETGDGFVEVMDGWVRVRTSGVDALVGAGFTSVLRLNGAPGIPLRRDAPGPLRHAASGLRAAEALFHWNRREDTLSIVNLLWRVPAADRRLLFDALAAKYPPPAGVTADRIVRGDWSAIGEWWDSFGFPAVVKLPPVFYRN